MTAGLKKEAEKSFSRGGPEFDDLPTLSLISFGTEFAPIKSHKEYE